MHRVAVDAFCIDRWPVTNPEFRRFVGSTGHRHDGQCHVGFRCIVRGTAAE